MSEYLLDVRNLKTYFPIKGGLMRRTIGHVHAVEDVSFKLKPRQVFALVGESGGGNQTMWVGAMDDRLKAVVPVVSVGNFETYICQSNCYCEVLPGALREFEEDAILSLVAPRHLKMLNALRATAVDPDAQSLLQGKTRKASANEAACAGDQNLHQSLQILYACCLLFKRLMSGQRH